MMKRGGYSQAMRAVTAILVSGCLLLAGCAATPVYRPAPTPNDYGYRTQALTDTRFRVSFAAGYRVARETVANLALFRAAQVALSHGARRLRIISSDTQVLTRRHGPVARIGIGADNVFISTGVLLAGGYAERRYQTVLVIQIGPAVPLDGPHVYNAREVKRHLAALANTARI